MSIAQHARLLAATAPQPFPTVAYRAWRIGTAGKCQPVDLGDADGADAVIARAMPMTRGDTFIVETTDVRSGARNVTIYCVRQRSGAVGYDPLTGRNLYKLYADPIAAFDVTAFEPVEPWRWTPGCDVVGGRDGSVL